jgi:hypothetical protein
MLSCPSTAHLQTRTPPDLRWHVLFFYFWRSPRNEVLGRILPVTRVVSMGRRNTDSKPKRSNIKVLIRWRNTNQKKAALFRLNRQPARRPVDVEKHHGIKRLKKCCIDRLNRYDISGLDPGLSAIGIKCDSTNRFLLSDVRKFCLERSS